MSFTKTSYHEANHPQQFRQLTKSSTTSDSKTPETFVYSPPGKPLNPPLLKIGHLFVSVKCRAVMREQMKKDPAHPSGHNLSLP
ncbi:hypothetical protein NPIL_680571 [Nephila pilipes]|uniref:Uncharacterized protein n=1 Tax=Nephila pilipes TaxID=299642 RepID=A0A8X6NLA3_NEPPI|nr:hypothetical protein NPIL_680571 [Nephila pilipes]